MASFYKAINFTIDGWQMNRKPSGNETGEVNSDSLPNPDEYTITEEFEVVEQPVPGFKTITQATNPEALKKINLKCITYTIEDWAFLVQLNNFKPHTITCSGLQAATIFYLTNKSLNQVHGEPEYTFHWEIDFCEANDNN